MDLCSPLFSGGGWGGPPPEKIAQTPIQLSQVETLITSLLAAMTLVTRESTKSFCLTSNMSDSLASIPPESRMEAYGETSSILVQTCIKTGKLNSSQILTVKISVANFKKLKIGVKIFTAV